MVIILIWAARDVGFLPGQWAALIVATILLAGLCVWIIGWDDDEEAEPEEAAQEEDEHDEAAQRETDQGEGAQGEAEQEEGAQEEGEQAE
jgi:hypothetical protein